MPSKKNSRIAVLVLAAGRGQRMRHPIMTSQTQNAQDTLPKPYLDLGGKPVLYHTLSALAQAPALPPERTRIVPVISREDVPLYQACIRPHCACWAHIMPVCFGGSSRQMSAQKGLEALEGYAPQSILIHDGVRPFVSPDLLARLMKALEDGYGAVVPGRRVVEALKEVSSEKEGRKIMRTHPRDHLWFAQTPQAFSSSVLFSAYQNLDDTREIPYTDDAEVVQAAGYDVFMIPGDRENIKLTTPDDLDFARKKYASEDSSRFSGTRVGIGIDVHALVPFPEGTPQTERHIMLGGVPIAHTHALEGHSDADVILHALTEALLGAIGAGNIGVHFPNSESRWKNAPSSLFLEKACALIRAEGGSVVNCDVVIVCPLPKIMPHSHKMRLEIARIAQITPAQVSIKATTTENLGFIGRREGIAAWACASVLHSSE